MSTGIHIVDGTLYPDGKVQLDAVPNVAPGRVTVFLQPQTPNQPVKRGLADVIDEIRQGQQARGFPGRTAEQINEALREGEDAYEHRMASLRPSADSGPVGDSN